MPVNINASHIVISGIAAVACLLYCLYDKRVEARNSKPQNEQEEVPEQGAENEKNEQEVEEENDAEVTLEKIAGVLWAKKKGGHEEREISIADIVKLWRKEMPEEAAEEVFERPVFSTEGLQKFWDLHVQGQEYLSMVKLKVIAALLRLLDEEGKCSSVVQDDSYAGRNPQYDKLSEIPLWQHSVNVATAYLLDTEFAAAKGNAIIAGLAHDVGKIPSLHEGGFYRTGDHPKLSRAFLVSIPEFKEINSWETLADEVENHHAKGSKGGLKAADFKARQMEVRQLVEEAVLLRTQVDTTTGEVTESCISQSSDSVEADVKAALKKKINTVTGQRWDSWADTKGIIWFQFHALNDALLNSLSGEWYHKYIASLGAAYSEEREEITHALLKSFKNPIDWDAVRSKRTPFNIAKKCDVLEHGQAKGERTAASLVPFFAAWFDIEKPSDIAKTYENAANKVIRSIKPAEPEAEEDDDE